MTAKSASMTGLIRGIGTDIRTWTEELCMHVDFGVPHDHMTKLPTLHSGRTFGFSACDLRLFWLLRLSRSMHHRYQVSSQWRLQSADLRRMGTSATTPVSSCAAEVYFKRLLHCSIDVAKQKLKGGLERSVRALRRCLANFVREARRLVDPFSRRSFLHT